MVLPHVNVCIIGGGISGLVTAYRLHQAGKSVALLEASSQFGGVISSEEQRGFLVERGPNSARLQPALWNLIRDLNIEHELVFPAPNAKNKYLAPTLELERRLRSSAPLPVPTNLAAAIRSPLIRYVAWPSIFRDLSYWQKPNDDESVAEFFDKRFGKKLREQLVAPVLNGIYAADVSRLSARSALSTVWNLQSSHGSVLRGALRKQFQKRGGKVGTAPSGMPKIESISFRHGLAQLVQALVAALPEQILHPNIAVERITPELGQVRIEIKSDRQGSVSAQAPESFQRLISSLAAHQSSFTADQLVLALPSRALASYLNPLDLHLANLFEQIPYAPLGVMHVAIEKRYVSHRLDGFGMLVPPTRATPFLGTLFSSSLFPHRAPSQWHLLTCFLGGSCFPDEHDPESPLLQAKLQAELKRFLGFQRDGEIICTTRYAAAIPNYELRHFEVLQALQDFSTQHPNIHILSNAVEGPGVPDRVAHAERLVARLVS